MPRAGGEAAARRLHPWPVAASADWLKVVNEPQSEAELEALRRSVSRGRPYGSEVWVQDIVQRLGLQATIRPRGRHGSGLQPCRTATIIRCVPGMWVLMKKNSFRRAHCENG